MKAVLLRLLFWIICIHLPFKASAQLQDSLDWIYEKLPTQIFPTGEQIFLEYLPTGTQ